MRATSGSIIRWRAERRTTVLVTGATGFLGAHLAREFLLRGYPTVLLARGGADGDAAARVRRVLGWFGLSPERFPGLKIVQGALGKPRFGLDDDSYALLRERVGEIVHAAADTRFGRREADQVEATNVNGLDSLFELLAAGRVTFFHYLSTAYAAGRAPGLCREAFSDPPGFHNAYERSKHRAERICLATCKPAGVRLNIYRPAIVYGDYATGRSLRFNAIYYPVKTICMLRDLLRRDIERDGGRARGLGVTRTGDGRLLMPLRIPVPRDGLLNLVPVDYFTASFMAIFEEALDGGGDIFHLVNPGLTPPAAVIDYIQRFIGVAGIAAVDPDAITGAPRTELEAMVDGFMGPYWPYIFDARRFAQERAGRILSGRGIACPPFDYPAFQRSMAYALKVEWGKKLFEPQGSELAEQVEAEAEIALSQ